MQGERLSNCQSDESDTQLRSSRGRRSSGRSMVAIFPELPRKAAYHDALSLGGRKTFMGIYRLGCYTLREQAKNDLNRVD